MFIFLLCLTLWSHRTSAPLTLWNFVLTLHIAPLPHPFLDVYSRWITCSSQIYSHIVFPGIFTLATITGCLLITQRFSVEKTLVCCSFPDTQYPSLCICWITIGTSCILFSVSSWLLLGTVYHLLWRLSLKALLNTTNSLGRDRTWHVCPRYSCFEKTDRAAFNTLPQYGECVVFFKTILSRPCDKAVSSLPSRVHSLNSAHWKCSVLGHGGHTCCGTW